MSNPDSETDGHRSFSLAIRAWREMAIRNGKLKPDASKPEEVRWSVEGIVPSSQLDTVRDK